MRKHNFILILATVGYLGKSPMAPGTVGSIAGLLAWLLLATLGPLGYVAGTLLFSVFAIFISQRHEDSFKTHDASEIVIDEVAGMLVALALLPVNWKVAVAGFLLFRLFDVLKPFPISYLDKKVGGGFGVVVDDLVAGLMANILLQALWLWQPQWLTV